MHINISVISFSLYFIWIYLFKRYLFGGISLLNFNCPAFKSLIWLENSIFNSISTVLFLFLNIVSGDFWRNWWEQIHFQPILGIIIVQALILLRFDCKLLWLTLDHWYSFLFLLYFYSFLSPHSFFTFFLLPTFISPPSSFIIKCQKATRSYF